MANICVEDAFSLTDRGSTSANEDFAYASEGGERLFGLVLDGATGLHGSHPTDIHKTEAQWLSHTVGTEMARQMLTGLCIDDALGRAIAYVTRDMDGEGCSGPVSVEESHSDTSSMPSSTLSAFEFRSGMLHLRWMGDSPIYVLTRGGTVTSYRDTKLVALDDEAIESMQRRRKVGMDIKEQVGLVAPMLREHRKMRNVPNGYSAIVPQMGCVGMGGHATFDASDIRCVAVMSDGMAAAFEKYGLADIRDFLENGTYLDAVAIVDMTRKAEGEDAYGLRWPRFKASDDASIVLARVR